MFQAPNVHFARQLLNVIKCNLMELTTRSTSHPFCGQRHLNMRMHQDSMCSSPEGVVALQRLARLYALAFLCAVGAPIIGCPTPPFPSPFPLFYQCDGCLLGFPPAWGLMAGLPGFASHGSGFHLGAGCQ